MTQNDINIHIESHQDNSFWYGTFTEFARANSLTPGQMFDISEGLQRDGKITVRGCGSTSYTLRKGARKSGFVWMGRRASGQYAY